MASCWSSLQQGEPFGAKGGKVTLRRWFSWMSSMESFNKRWHSVLLCLTVLGLRAGLFSDGDLPLLAHIHGAHNPASKEHAAQSTDGATKRDEVQEKLRAQCKSTLVLAARLLADPERHFKCQILVVFSKPILQAHQKEMKGLRGQKGCSQYACAWSCGSFRYALQKVWALLGSADALRSCGFKLSMEEYIAPKKSASTSPKSPVALASSAALQAACDFEGKMAGISFRLCLGIVRHRSLSLGVWRFGLPEAFAPLLSDSAAQVQGQLEFLSTCWDAIVEAEGRRHACGSVEKLLQALVGASCLSLERRGGALSEISASLYVGGSGDSPVCVCMVRSKQGAPRSCEFDQALCLRIPFVLGACAQRASRI